ncbi:I78 family peptidase inhibitor [Sphingomonas hengshuiensis]|uniref:Peptidase inhibitor I78 n=1 Tax=Sphingomonas hengshuiensis TaxID=1609977 RepID=A0A7U4LEQ0_9SPHN|nr:I78 family peptidase inhibitor [Sphingomonas hengshuiensis]AJP71630.1 hypothetical protein TS85_07280 [Sphingomonas hengshuiensis]
MIRLALLPLAALSMGACAYSDPPSAALPVQPGTCDAAQAGALVGRTYAPAMAAEVQALTGATAIRVLPPGTAATMDFRAERVNVDLDDKGRIVAVRCG